METGYTYGPMSLSLAERMLPKRFSIDCQRRKAAMQQGAFSTTRVGTSNGKCRFCKSELTHTLVDLGMSPLCETYLDIDQLDAMEPFYPLHVQVCNQCFLAQLGEYVS